MTSHNEVMRGALSPRNAQDLAPASDVLTVVIKPAGGETVCIHRIDVSGTVSGAAPELTLSISDGTVIYADPLIGVQRLFADEQIHGAPVVDELGYVLGVISMSDLLQTAIDDRDAARPGPGYFQDGVCSLPWSFSEDFREALGERRVAEAMTPDVVSVTPRASVSEIAMTLRHHGVQRVLVMEDGELLGTISSFDLIELLEKDFEQ